MMAEASGSRGRTPIWILRCLLLFILTPAWFVRNRCDGCAADDLLPDTSRTTGVLGVAIDLARPQAEGLRRRTRGMYLFRRANGVGRIRCGRWGRCFVNTGGRNKT